MVPAAVRRVNLSRRLAERRSPGENSHVMTTATRPLSYTEVEIRSYLPSGWGIVVGGAAGWDAAAGRWAVEVYDGADTTWTIAVAGDDAAKQGRLEALKAAIDRLTRKSLGRKSVITG
jgi:hypothetical protein